MEQKPGDAAAKALAFANGLRRNVAVAGRRWTQWPRGANDLATLVACIERIQQRLQQPQTLAEGDAAVADCIADLRAVLEWNTYQTASLATARALIMARKTRTFAERFGVLDNPAARLSVLVDSEESLLENIRVKNDYMQAIAARHPHLAFPPPLVEVESLTPRAERKPGKLALIQQLMKSAKKK